jgi:flagellar FliL protein
VRFLQVEVRLAAKDAETAELLKQNDPIVRNDLLMLFGNQDLAQLNLRNGKEHLRALALQAVRNVVRNVGGEPEKVDNVYFTSFVMQ